MFFLLRAQEKWKHITVAQKMPLLTCNWASRWKGTLTFCPLTVDVPLPHAHLGGFGLAAGLQG